MNKKRKLNWDSCIGILIFLLLLATLLLMIGCENPLLSPGPQPSYFDKQEFHPLLNIFGVLRPGTQNDMGLTFIHLEKSFPFNSYPDSVEIKDAQVTLYRYEMNVIVDSLIFIYTDFDSTFKKLEYRHQEFFPQARERYGISCRKEGYPELTSQTTMPSIPVIIDDTVQRVGTLYTFSIRRDSLAELYDITLWDGEKTHFQRLRRPETGNIDVEFHLDDNYHSEGILFIYVYDSKLAEYLAYNVSIKPNTYRAEYSTVNNGFGCFGSLNMLEKTVFF